MAETSLFDPENVDTYFRYFLPSLSLSLSGTECTSPQSGLKFCFSYLVYFCCCCLFLLLLLLFVGGGGDGGGDGVVHFCMHILFLFHIQYLY